MPWFATAPWWQIYPAITVGYGLLLALGAAIRLDGRSWLVVLAIAPVVGALFTWWVVVMRRGDQAVTAADPRTAMAARHALSRLRVPTEPAEREAARRLLPRVVRSYRTARTAGSAVFVLVAVALAVTAIVRRSGGLAAVAGTTAAFALLTIGFYALYLRRYRQLARELG